MKLNFGTVKFNVQKGELQTELKRSTPDSTTAIRGTAGGVSSYPDESGAGARGETGGNLGIGAATPAARLNVQGQGGQPGGSARADAPATWKRSPLVPNASRLMIGDRDELPLTALQAHVRVDGFRARVLLDCYYLNDRDRQFEGTFQLRLPDGASPYFLAFGEAGEAAPRVNVTEPGPPPFDANESPGGAEVVGVSGEDVTIKRPGDREFSPVRVGERLPRGTQISTGVNSSCVVRLPTGTETRVDPLTLTTLDRLPIVPAVPPPPPPRPAFFTAEQARQAALDPAGIMSQRATQWRAPKEARMVPREKAAFAYRETVNERVDPALLEWAGGGVFNARVFPLAPRRLHRIVVGYDVDLAPAGDALELRLDLPGGPDCVADVDLAATPGGEVAVSPPAEPFLAGGRAYYRFERPSQNAVIVRQRLAGTAALTGADAGVGPCFAVRLRPPVPADAPRSGGASDAVFLVDISAGSNPDRFNTWLKLLRATLDGNRASIRRFAVLFFNIEAFWWQDRFVENTPANADAVAAYADGLALEGATDLSAALARAVRDGWEPVGGVTPERDLFLLSDGAPTWGETDPSALAALLREPAHPVTLFAYATADGGTDLRTLTRLAREGGGAVFTVAAESDIPAAAVAHRARPWRIAGVSVPGGSDVLLAGRPDTLYPGQELTLAGRGAPAAGAEVVLALERAGERRDVRLRLDRAIASDLAPRLYGQIAVDQLEDLGDAVGDAAKAYAVHFRVTGRTCSLLMLEGEADYARYGIKPDEEAFIARRTPAAEAVAREERSARVAAADPKAAFLARLARMERAPGAGFKVPASLRAAVEAMPAAAFAPAARLPACRFRSWKDLPGGARGRRAAPEPDYDAIAAEARRRLDVAGPADALRAVSSLVEWSPGDAGLARDVAFSAMEWGVAGHAVPLLQRVADARPWEPQTYHALALAQELCGRGDAAIAWYEVALAGTWDRRFGEFRAIVAQDYLRLLRRVARGELATAVPDFARARAASVGAEAGGERADLRVILFWNTDATDVDLHVVESGGDECFYKNPKTRGGGRITEDVTQGYGPEMYTATHAPPGEYRVRVHYYRSDRNRTGARTRVFVTVIEREGTPEESVTRKAVTLEEGREIQEVITVRLAETK